MWCQAHRTHAYSERTRVWYRLTRVGRVCGDSSHMRMLVLYRYQRAFWLEAEPQRATERGWRQWTEVRRQVRRSTCTTSPSWHKVLQSEARRSLPPPTQAHEAQSAGAVHTAKSAIPIADAAACLLRIECPGFDSEQYGACSE